MYIKSNLVHISLEPRKKKLPINQYERYYNCLTGLWTYMSAGTLISLLYTVYISYFYFLTPFVVFIYLIYAAAETNSILFYSTVSSFWSTIYNPPGWGTSLSWGLLIIVTASNRLHPTKQGASAATDTLVCLWSLSGLGAPAQADNHCLSTIQLLHHPALVLVICCLIRAVSMQHSHHVHIWPPHSQNFQIDQIMPIRQMYESF